MQSLQKILKIAKIGRLRPRYVHKSASFQTTKAQTNEETNNAESHDVFTKEFLKRKIQISEFQRVLLAVGSSITSLLDPHRHDMIACLGETTGNFALRKIYENMTASAEGREILHDKPRINTKTINLEELKIMSENTLGYQYWKFLDDNKVTPDSRLDVKFLDDANLAYVMTRYRESHDLIHTILGMPTNMLGEVSVKWIEAINMGLPMCYGGAVFGAMRLKTKHRQLYQRYYLPWAIKIGNQTQPLLNVYWEKRWNQDINEIRNELNIELLQLPDKQ